MFPLCWDGIHLNTDDYKSYLAYPDLLMEGACPIDFTSRIPSLYYKTIWNTSYFLNLKGEFIFSNSDPIGKHNKNLISWH